MKKITHNIYALVLGFLMILKIDYVWWQTIVLLLNFYVLGSLNDIIDFKIFTFMEHRNFWTHSLISPIIGVYFLFGWLLYSLLAFPYAILIGLIWSLIYILHVLFDAWNPSGIYLTPKIQIRGKILSNNIGWNGLLVLIGIVSFIGIIKSKINFISP